jgi:MFS family permease
MATDTDNTPPPDTTLPDATPPARKGRGTRFWLILVALGCALCLVSIELTGVSTALPAITAALHADDFIWISSAYALASTAILPMSGNIAEIFGRRPAILIALVLFCIGSALAGAARTLAWLIGARSTSHA